MSTGKLTARDMLFEEPGPKARRRIRIATVISLAAIAVLAAAVVRRFYVTGQLDARYWFFFARITTWSFLGKGLIGTLEAAAMAGALAFAAGFLLFVGSFRVIF